jgi:hypothetical protein
MPPFIVQRKHVSSQWLQAPAMTHLLYSFVPSLPSSKTHFGSSVIHVLNNDWRIKEPGEHFRLYLNKNFKVWVANLFYLVKSSIQKQYPVVGIEIKVTVLHGGH